MQYRLAEEGLRAVFFQAVSVVNRAKTTQYIHARASFFYEWSFFSFPPSTFSFLFVNEKQLQNLEGKLLGSQKGIGRVDAGPAPTLLGFGTVSNLIGAKEGVEVSFISKTIH